MPPTLFPEACELLMHGLMTQRTNGVVLDQWIYDSRTSSWTVNDSLESPGPIQICIYIFLFYIALYVYTPYYSHMWGDRDRARHNDR